MRAPVIIIGIGGIGSDICVKVENMLPKDAPDQNVFRFVVMDTDVNTLREVRKKGFGGTIIRLSDNMTVAKCTGALEENSLSWYQENGIFANKPMTEGAGQYRAISRLAFEYAVYEEKINELERVIRQLNELSIEDSEQQIRFYVINSLAGGTGSGIALPLVLYLNHFFMEEFGEANFTCKGFFLLSSSIKQLGGARLEQDSVDANAYAAVKELSAYMRVADSREDRYRNLNEGVEKNANMTDAMGYGKAYDYCFLFGMLNQKGRGVHSFEDLKNLVANAVYVQACSPLHDKNSSMEDNTIKHMMQLAQKRGENFLSRFGGIGCGELVYPYEKLKRYLAFQWAIDAIGKRWQAHDVIYYELLREQEEKRRQGKRVLSVDQGEEYIRSIDNAKNDFLADEVKSICYPEGVEPIWKQFLQKMFDKISDDIEKYKRESEANNATSIGKYDEQFGMLENSKNNTKMKNQARTKICNLLKEMYKGVSDKSRRDASSYIKLWFVPHEIEDGLEPYWLEYYLVREDYFVHPSVVRYFLYQLRCELRLKIKDEEEVVKEASENVESYRGLKEKLGGIDVKRKLKESRSKLKEIYNSIFLWSKHFIYLEVLQKCNEYISELCGKFESFYQSCDGMLDNFRKECIEIADELDRKRGMVSAYVCANKVCREKLFQEIQESPYYAQAGKGFFYQVYLLVQSKTKEKRQQKILYDKFGEYWVENTEKEFGEIINLDILKAIEKQEWYMNGISVNSLSMTQWIQDAEEKLTNPFLQYMRDDDYHQGISLCCYNSGLKEKNGLHREIIKWLNERRGVEDEYYCSPYQLIFYRSFVGLNASRILEYLHEHVSDIRLRRGKAFRAYEKNVFDMSRNRDQQSRVSPHINRKWHNYLELPDTNREYQREMELRIGVVLWYAIVTGKISNSKNKYRFFIKETPPENNFNTYEECHLCLYENPYLVKELAMSMLLELKKQKDSGKREEEALLWDSEKETLKDKIKGWEDGIFQILIKYNEELELDKQDSYLNKILLDSLFILVTLFTEGDEDAIKEEWNKLLSEEVWERCREKIQETERTKEVRNLITSYLKEANVAEVHNLCTRLFFTEMEMT